jgi:hypothetical protein
VSISASAYTLGNSATWHSEIGATLAVLRSDAIDIDLGGGYEPNGWSNVPELVTRLGLGRAVAGGRVQATAAIGVGTARSEAYGDFDLAADHPVGGGVYAGLDARYRVDLAQDPDDSPLECEYVAQAAAFAVRRFGRFALIASAGVVDWKMRFGIAQTGGLAALGGAVAF